MSIFNGIFRKKEINAKRIFCENLVIGWGFDYPHHTSENNVLQILNELRERIWKLENPPKFKINDIVDHCYRGWPRYDYPVTENCKIVGLKYEDFANRYLIHHNGDNAFWANESELKLHEKK